MYATHKRTRLQSARQKQIGVTLIEILIAIVILGILSTIGVPSFVNMIKDARLASQASDVSGSIRFARSEAIKRNAEVTVQSLGADGSWSEGWNVVAEPGTANEAIVRVFAPLEGGNTLVCVDGCTEILFKGSGITTGSETLRLCDDRDRGRAFTLSLTGSINTNSENPGCS